MNKWYKFLRDFNGVSATNPISTELIPKDFYGKIVNNSAAFHGVSLNIFEIYYPDQEKVKCEIYIHDLELSNPRNFKELLGSPFKGKTKMTKKNSLPKKGSRFRIDHKKLQSYLDKHKEDLTNESSSILKDIRRLASLGLDFKVIKRKEFSEELDCYILEINTLNGNHGPWWLSVDVVEEIRMVYGS